MTENNSGYVTGNPTTSDLPGTNIASPIVPYKSTDKYATHYEQYGCGGYRTVDTTKDRNAIPPLRRKIGMLVNVVDVGIFKLQTNPTTDATKDADWVSVNATGVQDVSPTKNGNLITLSDTSITRTTVTDDLPTYVFNVFLKATATVQKFRWGLVVNNIVPTLNFITENASGTNSPATLLLNDADDLQVYTNTIRIFEFETWDKGKTWFVSTKIYRTSADIAPREVINRIKLDEAMSWEEE